MTTTTTPFFTVDTLQFSNRLQNAGLDRKIADEFAEAIKETQALSTESLATKHDLVLLKSEIKTEIQKLEYTLTLKMFAVTITAVSVISWLDKVIN